MPERCTANPAIPDLSTKRQIETQLHAKLEAAKTEYESASDDYKRALKRCDDLRLTHLPNGNGSGHSQPTVELSASQAVGAQRHAFEKYRRALDNFNKFLLYGDLPEWP